LADGANFAGNVTNGGTFVYDRSGDYTLAGDFSGSGTLVKNGDGTLAFDGAYDFAGTTTVAGGSLRFTEGFAEGAEIDLAGGGSLDLSGQDNTVAELAGSSTESTIDIDDGSLTVEQGSDSVFAGIISGSGGLMKTGDGNLNLTGTNTYSGPTSVTGGTLSVNGSITSTVGVAGGGKLGGNGTVGEVLAGEGGIVGPGNSIGKLNVAGDINFGDGSVYQVEVNAAGSADQIAATGTASIDDARVEVLAEAGDYAPLTEYTILTADGGVEGEFSGVSTDLAFLTPELGYTADAVTLTLIRNDAPFKSFAKAPNQVSVANALETLGTGSALYMAVLTQNAAGAAQAFGALSGEAQAGVGTYLIDESHDMRSAIGSRSLVSSEGPSIWIQGAGTWSESESREGLAKLDNGRTGMIGGVDFGKDTFRFGAVGGYFNGNIDARSLGSHADVKTELMGLFASWHNGRLTAQLGGTYAWHDVDTQRSIAFPGFAGAVDGKTNAHSEQVFGEASYSLNDGPIAIAPVVGFAHVSTHTDGFAETGTVGALRFSTNERNVTFASFGIRASGDTAISDAARFLPRVSARYVHGWGDLAGDARAMFAEGGSSFDIVGAAVGEDTGVLDAGFDVVINDRFSIGASGRTTFSQDWSSQSARVSVGLRF
jgi:outer membrane autotransporter protein